MRIVIVGASLAGTSTARALRGRGFDGEIVLIGAEPHLPYDRPPLSKAFLDPTLDPVPTPLLGDDDLGLDLRTDTRAVGLTRDRDEVVLHGGERIAYDRLVVATGAQARALPGTEGLAGVITLRSLDDALAMRSAFDAAPRVTVVGGGFIGAEVAVAARARDLAVTVVENLPAPLASGLGVEVGELLGAAHREHGVDLRCGSGVAEVRGAGRVEEVVLADGRVIPTDLLVVGIGAVPATAWLRGSGVDIDDGIRCDATLRAVGRSHVYAVGDVARWPHPLLGREVRVEHWTSAGEHGAVVAANLTGASVTAGDVPYVWSDQYGRRIQIVGRPDPTDRVTTFPDADGRHLAVYERGDRVTAVVTVDRAKVAMRARRTLATGLDLDTVLATAGVDLPAA